MTAIDETERESSPADEQPTSKTRSALRVGSRTLGELLVTAGVVVLLFVAYQLVWTNVQADRAAEAGTNDLIEKWHQIPPAAPEFDLPLEHGKPFALLFIPRLGADYRVPIVEGVSLASLAEGVGHYPETALPGELGNFSVAGHRATNGEPFAYLDQLRAGDDVVVETSNTWYTYKVYDEQIIAPTQVDVILPVPGKPDATPTNELMTLTTCNPRWASYQRLIFHAELVDESPKSAGKPAALDRG
ncbi:MAG TPA: class E sortase [Actinomycetes bacterium]|nr:class E sortase [Actinomycetes bacterium]